MRTISTAYEQLLTKRGGTMRRVRVSVKDSGGTFRDLTTYLGKDFVLAGSWGEGVDDNGFTGDCEVFRQDGRTNLSPYMTKSRANLGLAYPGTFSPLIDVGREVLVEWAIAPKGTPTSSLTWVIGMRGKVADHDPTSGRVRFTVVGRFVDLLNAFIEEERVYAHADPADGDATKGLRLYKEGDTYAVNELLMPGESKRNGHFYKVTAITTGIAGAEGTYSTTGGAVVMGGVTVTDVGVTTITTGTALEVLLQQLANDNLSGAPTITCPVSPGWLLKWWLQARTAAWTAMRTLVDQIGWELRDVWHSGSSDFRFELRSVDRAKVAPDRTFGPGDRYRLRKLAKNWDGIRNRIRVWFYDSADTDLGGQPKRKSVIREDAASKTKYGTRFMEVSEAYDEKTGTGSNIDTTAEANAFADAMLSDLKEPNAEQECDVPFFPFVELGDLYRFTDDGKHYDVNVDLAVVAYRHSFTIGGGKSPRFRTTLTCRGQPASGYEKWLERDAGRNAEIHRINLHSKFFTNMNTFIGGPGGAKAKAAESLSKHALAQGYDFHLSKTSGFAPSTSTLKQSGYNNQLTIGDGDPGETYYGVTYPWHFNDQKKSYGAKSEEFTVVPGYLEPKHVNPEKFRGELPPNGSFEGFTREEGVTVPPDNWEMGAAGVWVTDVDVGPAKGGADAKDGARYLRFKNTSVATDVRSKWFPISGGNIHELRAWIYRDSGDNEVDLQIEWVTYDKTAISTSTLVVDLGDLTLDVWSLIRTMITAPATAAFARVHVKKSTAHSSEFHVDGVRVEDVGGDWFSLTPENSWQAIGGSWPPSPVARRYPNGDVRVRLALYDGASGTTCATLPEDMRPPYEVQCAGFTAAGDMCRGYVSTAGAIQINDGPVSDVATNGGIFEFTFSTLADP